MKLTLFLLILFVIVFVVVTLIRGVQKAKVNGTYLQPDNPRDYVKSQDDLINMTYEGETVCPEEENAA